jgi:hypothetical protein
MVKCSKCGTGWTSSGLPLCPVCGTKVDAPEPVATEALPAPAHPYVVQTTALQETVKKNGSAVLDVPVEIRKAAPPEPQPYSFPILKPAPVEPPKVEAKPAEPPPEVKPAPAPVVIAKEKPVEMSPIDASAVNLPIQELKQLRISSRPLNGPLILGCLAYVSVLVLPIAFAFESHRVIGILGFTLAGFFAPFAPIAWLAGLATEKRRREQGLRPEGRVTLGRLLGQWGTLLFVAQATFGLIAVAAMRLYSRFPPTFWRGEF